MLTASLLALALGAEPLQVATVRYDLSGIFNQVPADYLALTAEALEAAGLGVVRLEAAEARLAPEVRRPLLRCREPATSCARELGAALGVEVVVEGLVTRTEANYAVRVQARASADGRLLAVAYEGGVDEGSLQRVARKLAALLAGPLAGSRLEALRETPSVHAVTTAPLLRKIGWGTLALGLATAAAGVGGALRRMDILNAPRAVFPPPGVNLEQLLAGAEESRVFAVGMFSVSGVSLISSAIFLALGFQETPVTLRLSLAPGGAGLGLVGRW
jgi:hypothetical protein